VSYILWDVDGTLVRNGKDAGNLYHEAVELAAGHAIAHRLPNMHGKTDGQILTETLAAHGLPSELHESARHHLDELSRIRHEAGNHRELCPGVLPALEAAAALGHINALLTGNGLARSRFKLTGAGLSPELFDWDHSYFGNVSPIRSELTLRAAAELGPSAIIIGDTPNDDWAADAAGLEFIAVATGAYTTDDLRETRATLVIDDLDSGLDALVAALQRD
jgi:phosphoglycolate phosphatase-like HAD superfamily hydrolase